MQLRCRNELLGAIGTQKVAEMGIAKFTLEDAPLLFLHATPGLQGNSDYPFKVAVGDRHLRIRK